MTTNRTTRRYPKMRAVRGAALAGFLDPDGHALVPVDMTKKPMGSGPAAWMPGSTWTIQFLYRDPAACGAGFNLSDAMLVTFTP